MTNPEIMESLSAPSGDPEKCPVWVPDETEVLGSNGEERGDIVEYRRRFFFPVTFWLQEHRGEEVTHKMYREFHRLCVDVGGKFKLEHNFSDKSEKIVEAILDPVKDTMLHLWDVRGELRPWLVEMMCELLVGTGSADELPSSGRNAARREVLYRGGHNSLEMILTNITSKMLKREREFSSEEVEESQETGQGHPDYDYEIERYMEVGVEPDVN